MENLAIKGSPEDKLINAVEDSNDKDVETLVASGVDLEARNNENLTILMIAAKKGGIDIASKLINAGANIGAKGRHGETSLFYAFANGHPQIVKLLITHGAAKYERDIEDFRMSAKFQRNNEMLEALSVEETKADS